MSEYLKPGSLEHTANSWGYCYGHPQPWDEISERDRLTLHAVGPYGSPMVPSLPDGDGHDHESILPGSSVCDQAVVSSVWEDTSWGGLLQRPDHLSDSQFYVQSSPAVGSGGE